jgi:hypothetical protein
MNITLTTSLVGALDHYRHIHNITLSLNDTVDELLNSVLTKILNDAELNADTPFPTPPSLNR